MGCSANLWVRISGPHSGLLLIELEEEACGLLRKPLGKNLRTPLRAPPNIELEKEACGLLRKPLGKILRTSLRAPPYRT